MSTLTPLNKILEEIRAASVATTNPVRKMGIAHCSAIVLSYLQEERKIISEAYLAGDNDNSLEDMGETRYAKDEIDYYTKTFGPLQ